MSEDAIQWPAGFEPAVAALHVRNERWMRGRPDAVFEALIDAEDWPRWYPHAKRVVVDGGGPLRAGAKFCWTTLGARIATVVVDFAPPARLVWTGRAPGVEACHAWAIEAVADGCRVVTEETQRGMIASLAARFLRGRLRRMHDLWLERLDDKTSPS